MRPEEIGARLQTAQTMSPAAREWVRVHNLLLALDGEWRQIDPATATARVRQLLGMAKLSWDSAWNRLWAAPRAEDIAALSNLPAGVGTAISQLQDERGID